MSENKWPLIRTFKCYKKKKKVKICWIFKYFLSWLVVALWKDNLASPVLYLPIPHIWRPKTFSQNSGAIAGPARCIPKLLKTAFKNHEALLTVYFLLPNMQLQNLPLSHRVFDLGRNRTRPGIGNRKQAPCQKNKSQIAVRCTPQAKYLKRKPSFWGAELLTIPLFFYFFSTAENRFAPLHLSVPQPQNSRCFPSAQPAFWFPCESSWSSTLGTSYFTFCLRPYYFR